jgi:hypothetical protein
MQDTGLTGPLYFSPTRLTVRLLQSLRVTPSPLSCRRPPTHSNHVCRGFWDMCGIFAQRPCTLWRKATGREHTQHAEVVVTDEYRTSQSCYCCHEQMYLVPAIRVVDGKPKRMSTHGSMRCHNPLCALVWSGAATQRHPQQLFGRFVGCGVPDRMPITTFAKWQVPQEEEAEGGERQRIARSGQFRCRRRYRRSGHAL